MLKLKNITAIVVTKGDHDLSEVVNSLAPFGQLIVWNNSCLANKDVKVYGRYLAIREAVHDVIYTNDDDAVIGFERLLPDYRDGEVLCNMPHEWAQAACYQGPIRLVGWGALFHRRLLDRFPLYLSEYPEDDLFHRECDRVFTGLNVCRNTDVPRRSLTHAFGKDRLGSEARHGNDLAEITRRVLVIKAKMGAAA